MIPEDCNATEIPAGYLLDLINKDLEEGFLLSLFRVVDAHRQPAGEGNIYYLTMDVVENECYYLSRADWRTCPVKKLPETVFGRCKAVFYLNLYLGKAELYNYNCTLSSIPPQLITLECPECPLLATDIAPYEDKARRMLAEYNLKSNNTNYFKVDKILRAMSVWFFTEIHMMQLTIRETNCPRLTSELSDCKFLEDNQATVGFCEGYITDLVFQPENESMSISCEFYYPTASSVTDQEDNVKKETNPSACANWEINVEEDCHFRPDTEGEEHKCIAQVYSSGRTKEKIILSQDCNITSYGRRVLLPHTMCRQCARPVRRTSEELQSILQHTLQKFNDESDHSSHFKVGEITKAKKQVVYGSIYEIEYSVKETNCSKDEIADVHPGCEKNEQTGRGHHRHCHGRRHCHRHRHGHRHGHGKGHRYHHHHPHPNGKHDQKEKNAQKSSSEEQAGLKPTPPHARRPVGSVQRIDLVNETDVFVIPIIPVPSHPMSPPGSPSMPEPVGPGASGPVKDPEPLPFPSVPSDSPGCPGEPKREMPYVASLLPSHK